MNSLSSRQLLEDGTQAVRADRLNEAIDIFKEILRREPDNVAAHNNLAVCYKKSGMQAEAAREFAQAVSSNPTRWELYNNLASALIATGKCD